MMNHFCNSNKHIIIMFLFSELVKLLFWGRGRGPAPALRPTASTSHAQGDWRGREKEREGGRARGERREGVKIKFYLGG